MIGWLLATLGTAALGSVFPLINIELYLLGVVATMQAPAWWALALAATVGQLAGKMLFYFAGRGSVTLGARLRRLIRSDRVGRWTGHVEELRDRCHKRPGWGLGVLFVGAITGIPPFTLMCFVSGAAGFALSSFLLVGFVGRTVHFLLVAGAPEALRQVPVLFG